MSKDLVRRFTGRSGQAQPADDAFFLADSDVEVDIEQGPGFVAVTTRPRNFEKFRIIIGDPCGPYDDATREDTMRRTETELGFSFPNGMPVVEKYSNGFEFEGRPSMSLPQGWTSVPQDNANLHRIYDEQGRWRAFYQNNFDDRAILDLHPRIKFGSHIHASIHNRTEEALPGGHTIISGSSYHYFMPSVQSAGEETIPCFIYANPHFWPMGECDFTRINREMKAVRKAEEFIARAVRDVFPGAFVDCGTEQSIISDGRESMSMGARWHGDVFAHWDHLTERRLADLRQTLKENLPGILGADNSLILKLLPTQEELADIKANPPVYQPPAARGWQKLVLRFIPG